MKKESPKVYGPLEEKINIVSHLAGCGIALAGMILIFLFRFPKSFLQTAGVLIYGSTLVLMYASSAWYHSRPNPSPARMLGRRMDHCAIFLLIAGTYTAVMLLYRDGMLAFRVLPVIWGCAAAGIVLNLFFFGKFKWFSILLYLVMGWFIILYLGDLIENMQRPVLYMISLGGLFFTIGVIFYVLRVRFSHALWHFFVLGGTFAQYTAVLLMLSKP